MWWRVGIALLTHFLVPSTPFWSDAAAGVVGTLLLTRGFYAYQRWRFGEYDFLAGRWRSDDSRIRG